ncbi:MAG TPA: aldehyde dehydrogenase (NADP(+)) [Acidobacteriota bacterium]|nr:aldehyde dehydrogenase (NADP(+)) [Acidobacteriota bacterium]
MNLQGLNFIGNELSGIGDETFFAFDPVKNKQLAPAFFEAELSEVDWALDKAEEAFSETRALSAEQRGKFLREIARRIMDLGEELINRAMSETGLPEARLVGERGRTVNQILLFADLVEEGSWVEARIDTADPGRAPIPKPDVRRMLRPLGPVAVFGASNFPLAFSVAGGDTASALAAGNPVVIKAHPAHPGTSELVAGAIIEAALETSMPDGVFSMLHGARHGIGLHIVCHPAVKAVGFTGSLVGGRALFDAAASREAPIPIYAEMGSTNPVFLLPGALGDRAVEIAKGFHQSVTLGVGQFCTNPGLAIAVEGEGLQCFIDEFVKLTTDYSPGTMLHPGIREAYESAVAEIESKSGVEVLARSKTLPEEGGTEAAGIFFGTKAAEFLADSDLSAEIFGPSTILVTCRSKEEVFWLARTLEGHLTSTLHANGDDLEQYQDLVPILEEKVGRLVLNGFPTGVEVCHAMHHGGPYPATTDVRETSVGSAAIGRFARPVCYQDFPESSLPVELKNSNPRGIWRLINGEFTRDDVTR